VGVRVPPFAPTTCLDSDLGLFLLVPDFVPKQSTSCSQKRRLRHEVEIPCLAAIRRRLKGLPRQFRQIAFDRLLGMDPHGEEIDNEIAALELWATNGSQQVRSFIAVQRPHRGVICQFLLWAARQGPVCKSP
jgi:hypothetical protein